ncbi:MAG: amidohydrolase [Candidatus Wallbacteria bacterium]|nr:amidohydrolase [Candidatus Wallbacteria bacterium]
MRVPTPPAIDDTPPPDERRYFDVHVHPWPQRLYQAITQWFDTHAWSIEQRLAGEAVEGFLAERGVARHVALIYAHKAGLARELNRWMAMYAAAHPNAVALGTVHPEDDVGALAREALDTLGLRGLKLHAHVMGYPPDDSRLFAAYELLERRGLPLVVHAGTEPQSAAYPRPCSQVSGLARLVPVLERFPGMPVVVPHLGAGEFAPAAELLERFPALMLDTAMVLARYFPDSPGRDWVLRHHRRIMYGTDFPILPYDYDRERRCILALGLGPEAEEAIFWGNAARVFGG